jgi:hypothetical protein
MTAIAAVDAQIRGQMEKSWGLRIAERRMGSWLWKKPTVTRRLFSYLQVRRRFFACGLREVHGSLARNFFSREGNVLRVDVLYVSAWWVVGLSIDKRNLRSLSVKRWMPLWVMAVIEKVVITNCCSADAARSSLHKKVCAFEPSVNSHACCDDACDIQSSRHDSFMRIADHMRAFSCICVSLPTILSQHSFAIGFFCDDGVS